MPETLGKYTLEKKIGSGGMADVFLARGPAGICVVKRPHPHLCENAEFVRMFLDEAALVAQLNHPGIARVFDLGHVAGSYYLAMEYVPGFDLMTISLEHERQGEFMDPELAARVVADAAAAMHYAHQAVGARGQALHIIHRDVTPHNILLSTTGQVKIIDFGVAKASQTAHKTQAGLVKGKYPYMSPEQITGQAIDRRVDVYALGLVLYELLTNSRAIAGDTELEQIDNARLGRIKPVEQVRPNVPEPLRRILAGALHPSPEGRYPTAAALQSDLEMYLKQERRPVGQEDLLRLFRVIAADATHLGLGGVPSEVGPAAGPNDDTLMPGKPTEPWQPSLDGMVSGADSAPMASNATPSPLPLHQHAVAMPGAQGASLPPAKAAPDSYGSGYDHPTERQLPAPPVQSAQLPSHPMAEESLPKGGGLSWGVWVGGGLTALAAIASIIYVTSSGSSNQAVFAPPATAGLTVPTPETKTVPEVTPVTEKVEEPSRPENAHDTTPVQTPEPNTERVEDSTPKPVKTDETPAKAHRGEVEVAFRTEPTTEVFVDGKKRGTTPLELRLSPGKHQLRFINKDLGFSRTQPLVLAPGDKPTEVTFIAKRGRLLVHAEPFADIFVDGKQMTSQPVSFRELEVWDGRYLVKVANREMGKSQEKTVDVRSGEETEVRFNLVQ